jgi:hypothetical protein
MPLPEDDVRTLSPLNRRYPRRTSSRATLFHQQAERCMQIARLMSNRQQARAMRKQAQENRARAEEIEKAKIDTQDSCQIGGTGRRNA